VVTTTAVALPQVPAVVGLDAARARRAIEDLGLLYRAEATAFSSTVAEGAVISQRPASGTSVEPGSEVRVTLSDGPQLVRVPVLTGVSFEDASRRATEAGLTVERAQAFNATVRQGLVAEQSPGPNAQVRPGSAVRLTVSLGPQRPTMPNVIGKSLAEAQRDIQAAGLRLQDSNINRQGTEQVPQSVLNQFCVGCVMSTDPQPGADVTAGQDVRIAIRRE
jgi:serine/threonine-protein kinase